MTDPTKLTFDSAVEVDGREDTTQLAVMGHVTQNEPLQTWEDHSGNTLAYIAADGSAVFNNQKTSTGDFQVKGQVNDNVLFVDASTDRVGIMTATPGDFLHIGSSTGGIRLSSNDAYPNIITLNATNFGAQYQGGFFSVNSRFAGFPNWEKTSTHAYDGAMFVRLAADRFELRFGDAANTGGCDPGTLALQVKANNVGVGESTPAATLHITGSTDQEQLIVKANATQTANLTEWHNSSGAALVYVTPGGGAVINNQKTSTGDFQVKGQLNDNALFVDASTTRVGIITATPGDFLHIGSSSGGIRLSSTDANPNIITLNTINYGAQYQGGFFSINSRFAGFPNWEKTSTDEYDGAMFVRLAADRFELRFGDATNTDGVDPGTLALQVKANNVGVGESTPAATLHITGSTDQEQLIVKAPGGGAVFNEQGNDADFRVEGDTDANLLFVDASADTVQIGAATASDSAKFYVNGKISTSDELEVNGALNHDGSTLGFYGTNPAAQPSNIADADGTLADITTKFNSLLAALENLGLLAAS
jgi:hypothetical protein